MDLKEIETQSLAMAEQGFFSAEDLKKADLRPLERFFAGDRGRWLIENRKSSQRELPFIWSLPV